jgi:hypothetical protein
MASGMIKVGVIVTAIVLTLCAIGSMAAGTEDPVQAQFQAYGAALQANDRSRADTHLQAALEASVARSGDGARTAELALELARLRLLRGESEAALAPAREAARIAEQRGLAAGIDADLARLTLARAALLATNERDADRRLLRLLDEIPYSPDIAADLLAAALELARTSDETGRSSLSRKAWSKYASLLQRRPRPDPLLVAMAQVGETRAAILERVRNERPLSPRTGPPSGESSYGLYATKLREAAGWVESEATRWVADFEPTLAQRVYGEAHVWLGVLRAKLFSEDRKLADAMRGAGGSFEVAPPADLPLCAIRVVREPEPEFPQAQRVQDGVGAVLLKLRFDEAGGVQRFAVVTSAGGPEFRQSVAAVAPSWHLEKDGATVQGPCRMGRDGFLLVVYRYV